MNEIKGQKLCAGCGKWMELSEERIKFLKLKNPPIVEGVKFCHISNEFGQDTILSRMVQRIDHPHLCFDCIGRLASRGYIIVECGCGG